MDELRATIAGAAGFWQVVPLLAGLSEAQCREIAPALERWRDASREAPFEWVERCLAGEAVPALSLCRGVSLADRRVERDQLARLLAAPELAGITRLELGLCARGIRAATLAGVRALRELRVTTIHEPFTSAVDDDDVAEIAAAPLARLERLSFDMVRLRGPGVAALARSTTLTGLRELELYAPATTAVCKGLAGLRGVQRLALCADGFTEAGASALAGGEVAGGLRALEFRVAESGGFDWSETFSGLVPEGARNARRLAAALARLLPALRECEYVSVEYCPDRHVATIDRADFAALAADPRRLRAALPATMRRP